MNIRFAEYQPHVALSPYIRCYWTGNFNVQNEPGFRQTVLPNGCIELIVHCGDAHCNLAKNGAEGESSPEFTLLGLYRQPYKVEFNENVKVFGIRFYPDGIRNIFGVPPAVFLATYEDGVDVLGKGLKEFCDRLKAITHTREQIDITDAYLLKQLAIHEQVNDYTHAAMKLVRSTNGMADFEKLAGIYISTRQLQRTFKAAYGITLRDYMRLSRMNAVHNYMLSGGGNLTSLTYELNFTDQSHFIKEYKKFTGIAPRKFFKMKEQLIVNTAT